MRIWEEVFYGCKNIVTMHCLMLRQQISCFPFVFLSARAFEADRCVKLTKKRPHFTPESKAKSKFCIKKITF